MTIVQRTRVATSLGVAVVSLFSPSAIAVPLAVTGVNRDAGILIGVDGRSGETLYRTEVGQRSGASLRIILEANGVLLVERRRCFSESRQYRAGDVVLVGLEARTGRQLWQRPDHSIAAREPEEASGWASPADGNVPVTRHGDDQLRALDSRTGETRWSKRAPGVRVFAANRSILVVAKKNAVTLATDPPTRRISIQAWSRATGQSQWSYLLDAGRRPRAIAASDQVIAVASDRPNGNVTGSNPRLDILEPSTGKVIRSVLLHANADTPAFVQLIADRAVVGYSGPTLAAVDTTTGAIAWQGRGLSLAGLPNTQSGLVFVENSDDPSVLKLVALDARSGATRWELPWSGGTASATQRNKVLALPLAGTLKAVRTTTGTEIWQVPFPKRVQRLAISGTRDVFLAGGCPSSLAD